MRANELKRLMVALGGLTSAQRRQVLAELEDADSVDEATAIVEKRAAERPVCPRCDAEHIVRNGFANGLQRYKCRGCNSTFNALTGTSLARLRHRDKWIGQAEALEEGLSVRKTATRLGVHRTTAFRWRHRWLAHPREAKASKMVGVVEADETYHLRSFKGQKASLRAQTTRRPRRRGGTAARRGLSAEQVPVMVLRNRSGETSEFVLPNTSKAALKVALTYAVADDSVLCTDGCNHLRAAASDLGLAHEAVNTSAGVRTRGPWHIQNVNAYHSRWKAWVGRFKGISTKYLPNYLGWFRTLDRKLRTKAPASSLLALAIDAQCPSIANAN